MGGRGWWEKMYYLTSRDAKEKFGFASNMTSGIMPGHLHLLFSNSQAIPFYLTPGSLSVYLRSLIQFCIFMVFICLFSLLDLTWWWGCECESYVFSTKLSDLKVSYFLTFNKRVTFRSTARFRSLYYRTKCLNLPLAKFILF